MTNITFLPKRLLPVLALVTIIGLARCQAPSSVVTDVSESPARSTDSAVQSDKTALTPVKFTLAWLLQGVDAPLTLAVDRGYFHDNGLEVTIERGYGSADTLNKLAAGQYDIGYGDLYSMIEFNQQNPDQTLVAIAVPFNKAPFALVALNNSGITSVEDLAGKRLGAPVGDGPRRLWPVLAEQIGIDPDAVEWVSMEPKLRERFLLQGTVDAISGFSYSMLPSLKAGGQPPDDLNIFYYTDNGLDFYGNAILVKASFLQKHSEQVRSFLKAYVRGMQDMLIDPIAGLDSVMTAGDGLMEREAEKLRLQIALDDLLVNDEVQTFGLGTVDPARLQTTIDQTVEGFDLKVTPEVEDVFDDRYLPPKEQRQVPPVAAWKRLE